MADTNVRFQSVSPPDASTRNWPLRVASGRSDRRSPEPAYWDWPQHIERAVSRNCPKATLRLPSAARIAWPCGDSSHVSCAPSCSGFRSNQPANDGVLEVAHAPGHHRPVAADQQDRLVLAEPADLLGGHQVPVALGVAHVGAVAAASDHVEPAMLRARRGRFGPPHDRHLAELFRHTLCRGGGDREHLHQAHHVHDAFRRARGRRRRETGRGPGSAARGAHHTRRRRTPPPRPAARSRAAATRRPSPGSRALRPGAAGG